MPLLWTTRSSLITYLQNQTSYKKVKISTDILPNRLHRPDGVLATIRAHNLWRDVDIIQGTDKLCTSCKIMSIPAASQGQTCTSKVSQPLEEIQVDTVPNPEPMGLSADTRFNYFLILCDQYSRVFRICGMRDKSSDACIDGIELLLSNVPSTQQQPLLIRHIQSDVGSEF